MEELNFKPHCHLQVVRDTTDYTIHIVTWLPETNGYDMENIVEDNDSDAEGSYYKIQIPLLEDSSPDEWTLVQPHFDYSWATATACYHHRVIVEIWDNIGGTKLGHTTIRTKDAESVGG